MRTLHDVQETTLSYKPVEIADRVAAEFLVVKIHPKPNPRSAVVDVEGAGFGGPGNDKEHEQSLRELDPFFDLGVLTHIQQSLHRPIRASADIVWPLPKIDHWNHIHLSKHWVFSSQGKVEAKKLLGTQQRRPDGVCVVDPVDSRCHDTTRFTSEPAPRVRLTAHRRV